MICQNEPGWLKMDQCNASVRKELVSHEAKCEQICFGFNFMLFHACVVSNSIPSYVIHFHGPKSWLLSLF